MGKARHAVLGVAVVVVLSVIVDKCVRDSVPGADARNAAEGWLKLVDAGKYAESWDEASETFHNGVSKETWIQEAERVRGPLGKLKSRRLAAAKFATDPSGAQEDIVQFRSSFQYQEVATERVVPMLEKDGKWRVSGYFVRGGENPTGFPGN